MVAKTRKAFGEDYFKRNKAFSLSTPCTPVHYKAPKKPLANTQPTKRKICLLGGFYAHSAQKSLV